MKFYEKLLAIFLVLFLLIGAGLFFFVNYKGKEVAEQRLTQTFHRPVAVESVALKWPLQLQVNQLHIPGVFSAKHVTFNLRFLFSLSPRILLSDVRIQDTVIYYIVSDSKRMVKGNSQAADSGGQSGAAESASAISLPAVAPLRILIRNLHIQNGHFFYQRLDAERPFQFEIKDLELQAENVPYPPEPEKILFFLQGQIFGSRIPFSDHPVALRGWVDFVSLSMNASAKVFEEAEAEGISAQIASVDNHMSIKGKLNLGLLNGRIQHKPVDDFRLGDLVMGAIQSSGLEFLIDFEIKTLMNDIRFDKINFSGTLEDKNVLKAGE